jgi:hypothetical protein
MRAYSEQDFIQSSQNIHRHVFDWTEMALSCETKLLQLS